MSIAQKKTPTARLSFRLNSDTKEIIEQAALVSGKSISEFAVSSLVQSAQEILGKHQAIRLSNRDFDALMDAVDADHEPNEALKRAAARLGLANG